MPNSEEKNVEQALHVSHEEETVAHTFISEVYTTLDTEKSPLAIAGLLCLLQAEHAPLQKHTTRISRDPRHSFRGPLLPSMSPRTLVPEARKVVLIPMAMYTANTTQRKTSTSTS